MRLQAAWQVELLLPLETECKKINTNMKLFEMFDAAVEGYQDLSADNSQPKWRESRKTKLTLKQIRKLRKMLDVRNYEKQKYMKKVHEQYGAAAAAAGAETPTV
jgi:hypothetical protein